MGVFKWLRRERVSLTVLSDSSNDESCPQRHSDAGTGTIRTEEYKRDLAEFQARRSEEPKSLQPKKKCASNSMACTSCSADRDTLNYVKKSNKHSKRSHKRAHSVPRTDQSDNLPNIQFLFQNQVFMPGNLHPPAYSESLKTKHPSRSKLRQVKSPELDFAARKHIDFKDDSNQSPPPFEFNFRNNSLPLDVQKFMANSKDDEKVDQDNAYGDVISSHSISNCDKNETEGSCEDRLQDVMKELHSFDQWADEQLRSRSLNNTQIEDSKSDASTFGLLCASTSNLNINVDPGQQWTVGNWGVIPVQVKKLNGVLFHQVKKKPNTEIYILRKFRHPNIILLMGLYPDIHHNVYIICERCVDTLYGVLHSQCHILSVQTSVQYVLDIANALVFLKMQGYLHTELTSKAIMITKHGATKLADLSSCVKLATKQERRKKSYEVYSPEPQYMNIDDTYDALTLDCEPLITESPTKVYNALNLVPKRYDVYKDAESYHWQAPELFEPDDDGLVYPCSKSDVYSLTLILWESCNAELPWKDVSYNKLKESYAIWKNGIYLSNDGTYPGCLLSLLQKGLTLSRNKRIDLTTLQSTLHKIKNDIEDLDYLVIQPRLMQKPSNFSSAESEKNPAANLDGQSSLTKQYQVQHQATVHIREPSTDTEKDCSNRDESYLYESINDTNEDITDNRLYKDETKPLTKYDGLSDRNYSSACSTPIAKIRARVLDMGTSGTLHRSDSTEYCSILSPDVGNIVANDTTKENSSFKKMANKLSRSFTPNSYKPLHIKVPDFKLDCIKTLPSDRSNVRKSCYNFDIKNYTLPSTPIARSNKLRKNAWLSGDLKITEQCRENLKKISQEYAKEINTSAETGANTSGTTPDCSFKEESINNSTPKNQSPDTVSTDRNSVTGLRRTNLLEDFHIPDAVELARENDNSYNKSPIENSNKYGVEEDILAQVNVKPLVAIHERWIYEANRKTARSLSLPDDKRSNIPAVKPASHSIVDSLQKSQSHINIRKLSVPKIFRSHPPSPTTRNGQWNFNQTKEQLSRCLYARNSEQSLRNETSEKSSEIDLEYQTEQKVDQATDTKSIEDFIRHLIRKEIQNIMHEIGDSTSTCRSQKSEEIVDKGVANIVEGLKLGENGEQFSKKDLKTFSRVKINGNNKPLLQITFSRSGENSLQVLDDCVNVTICDSNTSGKERLHQSAEETVAVDEVQSSSLKRCQAFNAIQEAKSTEDLYIDDDLSTHMQENFGGKVKLIPLHGSLHEIMCEREDDCCLIKVKQENGCDTIYFKCDNSDTESRDALDGISPSKLQDKVVFKRSISLVEERIQRVIPKEKRTPVTVRATRAEKKLRPKSEVLLHNITKQTRYLSHSSPSLVIRDDKGDGEVEVNIENVMCYQDSSSDECLNAMYQAETDDFELLERKIEEDLACNSHTSFKVRSLMKISEENLPSLNEDVTGNDS